jgi:hypothetical protein
MKRSLNNLASSRRAVARARSFSSSTTACRRYATTSATTPPTPATTAKESLTISSWLVGVKAASDRGRGAPRPNQIKTTATANTATATANTTTTCQASERGRCIHRGIRWTLRPRPHASTATAGCHRSYATTPSGTWTGRAVGRLSRLRDVRLVAARPSKKNSRSRPPTAYPSAVRSSSPTYVSGPQDRGGRPLFRIALTPINPPSTLLANRFERSNG